MRPCILLQRSCAASEHASIASSLAVRTSIPRRRSDATRSPSIESSSRYSRRALTKRGARVQSQVVRTEPRRRPDPGRSRHDWRGSKPALREPEPGSGSRNLTHDLFRRAANHIPPGNTPHSHTGPSNLRTVGMDIGRPVDKCFNVNGFGHGTGTSAASIATAAAMTTLIRDRRTHRIGPPRTITEGTIHCRTR